MNVKRWELNRIKQNTTLHVKLFFERCCFTALSYKVLSCWLIRLLDMCSCFIAVEWLVRSCLAKRSLISCNQLQVPRTALRFFSIVLSSICQAFMTSLPEWFKYDVSCSQNLAFLLYSIDLNTIYNIALRKWMNEWMLLFRDFQCHLSFTKHISHQIMCACL